MSILGGIAYDQDNLRTETEIERLKRQLREAEEEIARLRRELGLKAKPKGWFGFTHSPICGIMGAYPPPKP
jgi:hypothetical protein